MLDVLEHALKYTKIKFERLDGTMSFPKRESVIKNFKDLLDITVIL